MLKACKCKDYLIEPKSDGYSQKWESHHATNPTLVRFDEDDRLFLGYRAGGQDDYYKLDQWDVWASHLGLVILDDSGQKVLHRLPLPIMSKTPQNALPKTKTEYDEYVRKGFTSEVAVLHDFRFWNYKGYLHVIFHEGPITTCYDCIVRMSVKTFLDKIDKSLKLAQQPTETILAEWARLWWADGVWQPCGVNGTNLLFSSFVHKGDIVFFELADGSLQMCHRPLAEGMAVLNTGDTVFAKATADGLTEYGTFETCVRPGKMDNSHVGNNGFPTRAKIGDVDVYVDVTHGCYDRLISDPTCDKHDILYYPYFRVKDYHTGELLYYSEEPILDFDSVWREYTQFGTWVRSLDHLDGVMFVGGQFETQRGKNGLDDEFALISGLGDTAVGRATFTLRQLLPEQVIIDIQNRKTHKASPAEVVLPNTLRLSEKVNGWEWRIENNPKDRNLQIVRSLTVNGQLEEGVRVINTAPGYFDADAMLFDGSSIKFVPNIGWIIVYQGIRWDEQNGKKTSMFSLGLLVLDKDNHEKVLYRSAQPVGPIVCEQGWTLKTAGITAAHAASLLANAERAIPGKVLFEIKRMHELSPKGMLYLSQMVTWQRKKSGMIGKEQKDLCQP